MHTLKLAVVQVLDAGIDGGGDVRRSVLVTSTVNIAGWELCESNRHSGENSEESVTEHVENSSSL